MSLEIDENAFDLERHNGMVTVTNPATGEWRTFKISTQKEDASFAPGERLVALLIGPDRADYTNWVRFGWVRNGQVAVWSRFRGNGSPSDHERFARLLERPVHYSHAKGLRYLVEARCRRCNRALTVPASIDSGYGPECITRVHA